MYERFFETVYTHVFQAEEEFKELQYFWAKHIELEKGHQMTNQFKGENALDSLAKLKITPSQKEHALEAVIVMYEKYVLTHDNTKIGYPVHQGRDALCP